MIIAPPPSVGPSCSLCSCRYQDTDEEAENISKNIPKQDEIMTPYLLAKTIHPLAVNPSNIAFDANMTVARPLGFLYTASR